MLIKNISNIVNNKIDCNTLQNFNYISTENMLENFGGIKDASNVPTGKCTAILKDDILLSNIRPYFKKLWFSKLDGGCSNDVIALRVNNKSALSKYVFYALSSNKFFDVYVANCKGTKMPRGNKDVLLNYDIPTKSLFEQQHIIDTIGSIDDLLEKNEKIIQDLMKQSSLIIQKNNFENQEKSCNLSDVASVTSGKSTPKLEEGKYEIIGANGILGYTNDFNIQDNVIITGRVGTIGTFSQYNEKIWCSDNTLIIKSKYFNYLFYYLKENFNAKSFNRGSTQPLITQSDMLKFEIKVPSNIDKLEEKFNTYYQIIGVKKKENRLLKKEKDILLKKYFG